MQYAKISYDKSGDFVVEEYSHFHQSFIRQSVGSFLFRANAEVVAARIEAFHADRGCDPARQFCGK